MAVTILVESELGLDQARFVSGLGDPREGTVLIRLVPGIKKREFYRLYRALNDAIGALDDVLCGNTTASEEERFARAWYPTRGIHTVVVTGVEHLPDSVLAALVRFADDAELDTLWLVSEYALDDAQTAAVGTCKTATVTELLDAFNYPEGAAASPDPTGAAPLLPDGLTLPTVDFAVARSEAHRRLRPDLFDRYDALWAASYRTTLELIDGAGDEFGSETFAVHLQGALDRCSSRPEMHVTVQAAQAALLVRGWRLHKFDLEGLLTRLAQRPTPAQRTPTHWHRLHAYRQPWRGTVVALYAAGATIEQIRGAVLDDVAPDGSAVTINDRRIELPDEAHPFVTAQVRCRNLAGANERSPFIVHEQGYAPVEHDALLRQLQAAAEEVGFPFEQTLAARTTTRDAVAPSLVRLEHLADVSLPANVEEHAEPPRTMSAGSPPSGKPRVDGDAVRRRRIDLGIAVDDLARRLGLRRRAITRLEMTGDLDQVSASQLVTLASVLAVDIDQLLARPWDEPRSGGDVERLGSLLLAARTLVPLELICDTLTWSLDDARCRAEELDDALRPAGLRVHHNRGCIGIVNAHEAANVEETAALLRAHRARRQFMSGDARVLLNLLDPAVDLGHAPERARTRLRAAGMITHDDDPQPTEDVLFSLGLASQWAPSGRG